jgi:glycosyltransferase involved in cell wall biosynthesis
MDVLFLPVGSVLFSASRVRVYDRLSTFPKFDINPILIAPPLDRRVSDFHKKVLRAAGRCDIVYIHRHTLLFPRPFFNLLKERNPNIIYDFDDAIFTTPPWMSQTDERVISVVAEKERLEEMLQEVRHVIVVNDFLAKYARQFNENVTVIPDLIDTKRYYPGQKKKNEKIVIGWIGNKENTFYLKNLESVFKRIQMIFGKKVIIEVVCRSPVTIKGVELTNIKWEFGREIQDMQRFDIGISPLTDHLWSLGKGMLKTLQYMSLAIPVVVSPIGFHKELVADGEDGFWAETDDEWVEKLSALITDPDLRERLGRAARRKIVRDYSIRNNLHKLVAVFKKVLGE